MNEYESIDDLLRDALSELTTALVHLNKVVSEGANHLNYNVNKASEAVMKAGRAIERVRGVKQ